MKKSILYTTLLLITSLCLTACGGSSGDENQPAPTAVSGNAISENKQDKGSIPSKVAIKNPYYDESETAFIIKKQNSQEYQAEINLCVDEEDAGEQSKFNWELYLEMVDEIKEISGATIVSHEGTHYIIRGNTQKSFPDSEWNEDEDEGKDWKSIADWEIYLECEDTIESITGAEIVSHEGNVYCIRAADPKQWIEPYSFTTFQVKVSCPAGIHPLGKTYLKRAKTRLKYGSDATEQVQEFSFDEDAFQNATGPKWLSYYELYDPVFDTDYFEDLSIDEYQNFCKRQTWGKKMGRMP